MNNDQENHVRAIREVITYCGKTDVLAATNPINAFAPMVADTVNKLVLIDGYDHIAVGDSKGVTEDTQLVRAAMEAIGFKCARGTFAYANSVHNNTLKAKVNYTLPKLQKLKMDEVDDVCDEIATQTNNNIGTVVNYGVLAGDPAALTAAVALYRAAMGNTRGSIITKTGAIEQIDILVRIIFRDNFKGQMDPMMDTLMGTADDIRKGYYRAKEIIDLGHVSGKIRGVAVDPDGNTMNGVLFTAKKAGTQTVAGTSTSALGGRFGIYGLFGDYDCTWEMTGKITVAETIHVAAGKSVRRKIVMEPV